MSRLLDEARRLLARLDPAARARPSSEDEKAYDEAVREAFLSASGIEPAPLRRRAAMPETGDMAGGGTPVAADGTSRRPAPTPPEDASPGPAAGAMDDRPAAPLRTTVDAAPNSRAPVHSPRVVTTEPKATPAPAVVEAPAPETPAPLEPQPVPGPGPVPGPPARSRGRTAPPAPEPQPAPKAGSAPEPQPSPEQPREPAQPPNVPDAAHARSQRARPSETAPDHLLDPPANVDDRADDFFDGLVRRIEGPR